MIHEIKKKNKLTTCFQSHSLWYTSSRNPLSSSYAQHDVHLNSLHNNEHGHGHGHGHQHGVDGRRRGAAQLIERSPLARLRADEQNIERRRQNVMNYGSGWLKPPGLPKTLHQLREERREAEEHQEAMRREQLAQELAEAEAEAAAGAGMGDGDVMLDAPPGGGGGEEDAMDDVQLDGARDLDDDIPEADGADFGFSGDDDDDDDDEDDSDDEDEEEEDDDDDDDGGRARDMHAAAQIQQQQLVAQHMRQANDAFREGVARGRDSAGFYTVDDDVDESGQSDMLEEDDLVGGGGGGHEGEDMGMDGDLDDEIPEAESMGGYEHTDTEAELSSSEDDDNNEEHYVTSQHMASAATSQQMNRFQHSLARSDATRNSIAISDILSHDESSVLGSSPAVPRQRGGPSAARRGRG